MQFFKLFEKNIEQKMKFALCCFFFSHGLILSSWASRIPTIKMTLDITDADLGILLLLMPIGQISTMSFAAGFINKFGIKTIIKFSFWIYLIVLISLGFAMNYWQLIILLFVFGAAGNFYNISLNTLGVEFEKKNSKPMISLFHGIWSIASLVGGVVGLIMFNTELSLHYHFLLIGVISIIILFTQIGAIDSSRINENISTKKSIWKQADFTLVKLGLIGFCSMAIEGAMFDWSGIYFQDIVKSPDDLVILGYVSFVMMAAIGRFVGNFAITKMGHRKVVQLSGLLMCCGLLIAVLIPSLWVCIISFMMVGLGSSCCIPTIYGIAGKYKAVSTSVALTVISGISFLGFLIAPPFVGFIAEIYNLKYSFFLFSFFGFIIFLSTTFGKVVRNEV